jgi:hypothetical protein
MEVWYTIENNHGAIHTKDGGGDEARFKTGKAAMSALLEDLEEDGDLDLDLGIHSTFFRCKRHVQNGSVGASAVAWTLIIGA